MTLIRLLVLILTLNWLWCTAQIPRPSCFEKRWAIAHPIAALKVKKISRNCYTVYKIYESKFVQPDFLNGGRPDAFRHLFFMAAYAQKIKVKKLRKLGKAHERGNYRDFLKAKKEEGELPDSLASVMDLFNNEIGLKLGNTNKKISFDELATLAVKEIEKGNAVIMKRRRNGTYLDCEGKEIDNQIYRGKWNIPKCLVPSNTAYID